MRVANRRELAQSLAERYVKSNEEPEAAAFEEFTKVTDTIRVLTPWAPEMTAGMERPTRNRIYN
jgi:hypothetical protein